MARDASKIANELFISAHLPNEKLEYLDSSDTVEIYVGTYIRILMRVKALHLARATISISTLLAMQYLFVANNIFSLFNASILRYY